MDIVCFSHLRWDFVFQRPQHLLTRLSRYHRVFYIEEAYFHADQDRYEKSTHDNIHVIKLHVSGANDDPFAIQRQKSLINQLSETYNWNEIIAWFYTPMALAISADLHPEITIYDCMDELSAFRFAPPQLKEMEKQLLKQADIVFTGGYSLYEAKKHQHPNVKAFPSSIDRKHFGKARKKLPDPVDQAWISGPRFGFYGVIDERFDITLIDEVAKRRPEWQFIIVGPVVKIDPATLPRYANVHYLGSKKYDELPVYLSNWDVAMISFELNESTKFISPTKTPEYLAAGKPVISTQIRDVITSYGKEGMVEIASNADEFIEVAENILNATDRKVWLKNVDKCLAQQSWDKTVNSMREAIYKAVAQKHLRQTIPEYFNVSKALPVAS